MSNAFTRSKLEQVYIFTSNIYYILHFTQYTFIRSWIHCSWRLHNINNNFNFGCIHCIILFVQEDRAEEAAILKYTSLTHSMYRQGEPWAQLLLHSVGRWRARQGGIRCKSSNRIRIAGKNRIRLSTKNWIRVSNKNRYDTRAIAGYNSRTKTGSDFQAKSGSGSQTKTESDTREKNRISLSGKNWIRLSNKNRIRLSNKNQTRQKFLGFCIH